MTELSTEIVRLEHETGVRPIGEYPDHCRRCEYTAAGRDPFEVEMLMRIEAAFEHPRLAGAMVPIILEVPS